MFKNKKTIYYQGAADKTEKLIRQRNTRQSNFFILGNFLKVSAKNTNPNGLQILKHLEVVSFRKLIVSPEDYLQKQRRKKISESKLIRFQAR
jgi:hypothetical protein